MDLHIHTPASVDYQQPGVSALDLLRKGEERGLDIMAFTDHNSVRGYADLWREIEDLELLEYLNRLTPPEAERLAEYRRLLTKILLLPGFEFTAAFGFHVLAIFPETTSIRMMEHLLLSLGIAEDRFGSGEVGATSDVLRAYELLAEHGAIVIGAHVNSTHGVAMQGLKFGGQTKIAYTQDPHLHALEVTDLDSTSRRSTAVFFSGIKAEYPRRMHCIQGSDAHRLDRDPVRETNLGIGDRATDVLLPEVSFAALKALFAGDDFTRIRPARPGGPAADALHAARDLGNTATQVFYERLPATKTGHAGLARDAVALANGNGGTIYLGVGTAERRTVTGVPNAAQALDALLAELRDNVQPALEIASETIDYGGKAVLALHVPDGAEKPYAVVPAAIFVRRGAETTPASRDEIVAMVRGVPWHTAEAAAPATTPAVPVVSPPPSAAEVEEEPEAPAPEPRRGRRDRRDERERAPRVEPTAAPAPNGNRAVATQPPAAPEPLTPVDGDPIAPRTGCEIVDVAEVDGEPRYAIRDLRSGAVTEDVVKESARRLWQYAIQQRESRAVDQGHIRWKGDYGFWKVYRPSRGERRFNLAYRGGDDLRIFYGVSEEGLSPEWRSVLPASRGHADEE